MKTSWVATLNAGKLKGVFRCLKNLGTVLLISLFLLINSCDKSDDLGTINNELPPKEEPPVDEVPPDDEVPPVDEEPSINDESLIIYTDIEPDFTGENLTDIYELDLNNDQVVDFTLSSSIYDDWGWFGIASNPIAGNSILSVSPWYSYPIPLDNGQKIFNLEGYTNGESYVTWGIFTIGDCFSGESSCFIDWKAKGDKYLGLRLIINGKKHYGWARLSITSATQWVIRDYAYNSIPNSAILAGQKE